MSLTSPLAGRLVDRIGSRPVLIVGAALLMLGMLLTGVGNTLPQFYVASILTGMGLASLLGAPLRYIMLNEASGANTASSQGVLALLLSVGQLSGGVFIGAVSQQRGGATADYQTAFVWVGALGLLLTLTAFLLKAQNKESSDMATTRSASIMADMTGDRLEYATQADDK